MRILIGTLVFSFLVYAFIFVNKGSGEYDYEKLGEDLGEEVEESSGKEVNSLAYAFKKINEKMEDGEGEAPKEKAAKKEESPKEEEKPVEALSGEAFVEMVTKKASDGFEKAMNGEEISGEEMELLKEAFSQIEDPKKQVEMAKNILKDLPAGTKLPMRALFWTLAGDAIKDKSFVRNEVYPDIIATLNSEIPEEDPEAIMTTSMMFHIYVGNEPSPEVFDKSIEIIKLQKSDEAKKMLFARLIQTYGKKLAGKTFNDF